MIVRDQPAHRMTLECDEVRRGNRDCRVSVDITSDSAEKCAEVIRSMGWIMDVSGRTCCPSCARGVRLAVEIGWRGRAALGV